MTGATVVTVRGSRANVFKVRHDGMGLAEVLLPHMAELALLEPEKVGSRMWELWRDQHDCGANIRCPEQRTGVCVAFERKAPLRSRAKLYEAAINAIPDESIMRCSYEDYCYVLDQDQGVFAEVGGEVNRRLWQAAPKIQEPEPSALPPDGPVSTIDF